MNIQYNICDHIIVESIIFYKKKFGKIYVSKLTIFKDRKNDERIFYYKWE